jgi:hypothetical protein
MSYLVGRLKLNFKEIFIGNFKKDPSFLYKSYNEYKPSTLVQKLKVLDYIEQSLQEGQLKESIELFEKFYDGDAAVFRQWIENGK